MSEPSSAPAREPPPASPFRELADTFWALRKVPRTFWIVNAVYLLDGAAYFGILNILTLFLGKELRFDDRWSGYYVGYLTGMLTLFLALLGTLSDRIGVRRALTLTILAGLVGRVALTLSPQLPAGAWYAAGGVAALGGLTFMAFSAGVMQAAVYAGVKQSTDESTKAIGFSLVYALMNGGIVLESFASSLVREKWGLPGVLWMCVGITVLYLLVHLLGFPRGAGQPVARSAPAESTGAARRTSWRQHALANPRFLFFIFVLLGVRTLFAHQWLTMPDYITRAFSAEVGARYEWLNGAINPLIILIGTPLVAGLTRRKHVVTMMITGTLISAGASFLLVSGPHFWALFAYFVIFSIGEAFWSSRFLEYVADVAPADKVGMYMGVAQIPWFIAKFTTSFYSGAMLTAFCPAGGPQRTEVMWLIYGVIGMTTPIGLLLAQKWLKAGRLDDHVRPAAA